MAASTVVYSLTDAAYQDVSGGATWCSFRQPWKSQKDNAIRVHLGTALPTADTIHFDAFEAPAAPLEERQISFPALASTDRVYVRAVSGVVSLAVYTT